MKGCCARALHVERGAEGFWQQRAAFSHADLHEELVELGTVIMARVRRSIWRASDDLSSQSRPVVCTAGRSTMLLTLEDFAFFCEEFKLPVSNAQLARLARGSGTCPAVSYAQISLIEIGGDHLDRMMAQKEHSRWMGGCLRRSEHLVRSSMKSIYFVNATSLLAPEKHARREEEGPRLLTLEESALISAHNLQAMKELPASKFDHLMQSMLHGARARIDAVETAANKESSLNEADAPPIKLHQAPPSRAAFLLAFLPELLQCTSLLSRKRQALLKMRLDRVRALHQGVTICDTMLCEHVRTNAEDNRAVPEVRKLLPRLDVEGVVATLAKLFDASLLYGREFDPWLTESCWESYLDIHHSTLEMPSSALLRNACTPHHLTFESTLTWVFSNTNCSYVWPSPAGAPSSSSILGMKRGPVAIRFPYFTPLLDVIDSKHMARGLPPEWWLEVEPVIFAGGETGELSLHLKSLDIEALHEALRALVRKLQVL
ncbi:MAG: hypothetical protein SGPRY_000454 [Prymnesium sp.]